MIMISQQEPSLKLVDFLFNKTSYKRHAKLNVQEDDGE